MLLGVGAGCGGAGHGTSEPAPTRVAIAAPITNNPAMVEAVRGWSIVREYLPQSGSGSLEVVAFDTPLTAPNQLQPVASGVAAALDSDFPFVVSLVTGGALEPILTLARDGDALAMSLTAEEDLTEGEPDHLLRGVLATPELLRHQIERLALRGEARWVGFGPAGDSEGEPRQAAFEQAVSQCAACSLTEVQYDRAEEPASLGYATLADSILQAAPEAVYLWSDSLDVNVELIRALEIAGYLGRYYFAYSGFMVQAGAWVADDALQRLSAFDLAAPPSAGWDDFEAAYELSFAEPPAAEPRTLLLSDFLALLSLALIADPEAPPSQVALTMRELSRPPGEPVDFRNWDVAAQRVRDGQPIDFVGLSGPLDFNDRGDVQQSLVVEYRLDETGAVYQFDGG